MQEVPLHRRARIAARVWRPSVHAQGVLAGFHLLSLEGFPAQNVSGTSLGV